MSTWRAGRSGRKDDDSLKSKKSHPSTRFSRSVEIRLFIFPTRLLEPPTSPPASLPLSDPRAPSFHLPLMDNMLTESESHAGVRNRVLSAITGIGLLVAIVNVRSYVGVAVGKVWNRSSL